jgi:transcriptional regulator
VKVVLEFTKKEVRVLKLRYEGLKSKEIAKKLGVSPSDICQTFSRITAKLVSTKDTIELLNNIGVIKNDLEITFTNKGQDLLKTWLQVKPDRQSIVRKEISKTDIIVQKIENKPNDYKYDRLERGIKNDAIDISVDKMQNNMGNSQDIGDYSTEICCY